MQNHQPTNQPTHTTTTTTTATIHSLSTKTNTPILLLTLNSPNSDSLSFTHSLPTRFQIQKPHLSLSLWFHGTQRLTPSLQPSVDSVEKSPPKKTKTKKIFFLCWLFPIFPRIGWLGFIGLCSPPPYSSSSSSSSVSFLFSTLAPVTLIRFTGKFLRFRRPIFHGSVTFQWLNFKLLSPFVCLITKLGLVIL